MTSAFIAAADQAEAAAAHLDDAIQEGIAMGGMNYHSGPPIKAQQRILKTFYSRLDVNDVTYCPHIASNPRQVIFWSNWEPGALYCGECMVESSRKFTYEESHTCDNCHTVQYLTAYNCVLPSLIDPQRDIAQGPTIVQYGLCSKCAKER